MSRERGQLSLEFDQRSSIYTRMAATTVAIFLHKKKRKVQVFFCATTALRIYL